MKTKNTKLKTEDKREEVEILKNQLARALADYDNLRKRTEEEKIGWIKFATQRFIQNLLPVLDTFEAAQVHLKDQGLAIAIMQFEDLVKNEGLEEINPKVGEEFNPDLMEVTEVLDGKEDNKIAETVLSGWKFVDGQVVRHARVKVFKAENPS